MLEQKHEADVRRIRFLEKEIADSAAETDLATLLSRERGRAQVLEEEVLTLKKAEEDQTVDYEHDVEQLHSKIRELEAELIGRLGHTIRTDMGRLAKAEQLAARTEERLQHKKNALSEAKQLVKRLEQQLQNKTVQLAELGRVRKDMTNQDNSKSVADAERLAESTQKVSRLEKKLNRKIHQLAAMK